MSLNWGGFDRNNDAILEELGLTYESYTVQIKDGREEVFLFRNFKYEKTNFIENGMGRFMAENADFVDELVAIYHKHSHELKK